jgi:hypothetical protein
VEFVKVRVDLESSRGFRKFICISNLSPCIAEEAISSKPAVIKMKGLLATCGFQPGDLYKCYGELSSDIHGGSWSGPSILINKSAMSDKNACLIEALARATNLIPDIVNEIK